MFVIDDFFFAAIHHILKQFIVNFALVQHNKLIGSVAAFLGMGCFRHGNRGIALTSTAPYAGVGVALQAYLFLADFLIKQALPITVTTHCLGVVIVPKLNVVNIVLGIAARQ